VGSGTRRGAGCALFRGQGVSRRLECAWLRRGPAPGDRIAVVLIRAQGALGRSLNAFLTPRGSASQAPAAPSGGQSHMLVLTRSNGSRRGRQLVLRSHPASPSQPGEKGRPLVGARKRAGAGASRRCSRFCRERLHATPEDKVACPRGWAQSGEGGGAGKDDARGRGRVRPDFVLAGRPPPSPKGTGPRLGAAAPKASDERGPRRLGATAHEAIQARGGAPLLHGPATGGGAQAMGCSAFGFQDRPTLASGRFGGSFSGEGWRYCAGSWDSGARLWPGRPHMMLPSNEGPTNPPLEPRMPSSGSKGTGASATPGR